MSPSITEFLFELGVGHRVVGVTNFCTWPEEACRRPKVGGLLNPNLENWITLKPDLVILQETSRKLKTNAKNLGISTLTVSMKNLESIYESLRRMGKVLGCEKEAAEVIARLESGIASYQARLAGIPPKSTLLLLGDGTATNKELYAVGPNTFLGQLLEIAGGRNIVDNRLAEYPIISKEFILQKSPEVIIEVGPRARLTPEQRQRRLREWSRFATLKAVRTGQIHFLGQEYIVIPGPRLLKILEMFARSIHPEIFSLNANASVTGE